MTRFIDLLARCLSNSVVFKLASLECQRKYLWCVQLAFSERVRRLLLEAVVTASRKTGPFAPTGAGELTGHWTRHEKYDMKTFPQLALTFGTGSPNWVPQLPRTGDCFKRVGPLCEKASGTCVAKSINLHTLVKQCQNARRRQNTSSLCSWSSIRLANTTGIGSSVLSFQPSAASMENDLEVMTLANSEHFMRSSCFSIRVRFRTIWAPRQHLDTHQEPERLVEQTWMNLPQAAWDCDVKP